jgi:NAD(P)-dependent dehydrogenase (short-subunit alcohol dehydrogenase family)
MTRRVLLVLGAGPGLGLAVARRFGAAGYATELIARDTTSLERACADLAGEGVDATWVAADLADEEQLRAAVRTVGSRRGHIDVLHFNPSVFRHSDPLQLRVDELLADVAVGAAALLTAVQAARPWLGSGARVTATGSMAADQPWHEAASLGVQKAALRNLVLSLDRTLEPDGIRATSLTVNGTLAAGTAFSPERVAEALFTAATAEAGAWRPEVRYDG